MKLAMQCAVRQFYSRDSIVQPCASFTVHAQMLDSGLGSGRDASSGVLQDPNI